MDGYAEFKLTETACGFEGNCKLKIPICFAREQADAYYCRVHCSCIFLG